MCYAKNMRLKENRRGKLTNKIELKLNVLLMHIQTGIEIVSMLEGNFFLFFVYIVCSNKVDSIQFVFARLNEKKKGK